MKVNRELNKYFGENLKRLYLLKESERKFEDISRKMATIEADGLRGNERADGAEKKIKVAPNSVSIYLSAIYLYIYFSIFLSIFLVIYLYIF